MIETKETIEGTAACHFLPRMLESKQILDEGGWFR